MIKRIHVLIVRSYLGPFVLTFFISLFILLMQFLWKYIDDLVGKGLEWYIIAELLLYASATLVPMALLLAILLSSIMTFGNLGEHYELVALKSSGISLQKIMFPLIIISIIISISAFFFSNNVMPYTNLKMRSLLYDVRCLRPELNIKEGIFYKGIDGISIKIGKKDKKNNILYNIMIYNHRDRFGNMNVTIADSGVMNITDDKRYLILTLNNGCRYEEIREQASNVGNKTYPHQHSIFEEQTIVFEMEGFGLARTDEELFKDHYEMLNYKQLGIAEDSLIKAYNERKKNFAEHLLNVNYFKRENKQLNNVKKDTLTARVENAEIIEFDTDSLFENLEHSKKVLIADMASNFARSTKSYISTTKEDCKARMKWIRRHQIEWHRKFSLSFACLVFFFIGAPLGAIIRKGGLGMPVVVSVLFFILYYVISITGEKYVKTAGLPAYQGMWISSVILLPLGFFLTYKAATDSVILDIDTYLNFFKKIFFFRKKSN